MPTKEQLRQWYQKFSQELYEKVEIDVTRKEDLGRVRVCKSDQWGVDNLIPDMQVTFAYMSHDGTKYADPEPPVGKFQDYARWMNKNLNPEVSDEQIQKLYEQSRAGELMVFKPGEHFGNVQMVLTDDQGNIKISVPVGDYFTRDEEIPEEERPFVPEEVKEPTKEQFGFPQLPEPPKNLEPNWLSKLLDFFGIHTEYTDLKNYQAAITEYPDKMAAWEKSPNGLAAYNQAVTDRAAYVQQAEAFLANPYCRHLAVFRSHEGKIMSYPGNEFEKQLQHRQEEQDFLKRRHDGTPQGKLKAELAQIKNQLSHAKDTEVTLYNVIGHDPHPELMPNHEAYKNYHPESYDLPIPELDGLTEEQEQALEDNWKDLAAIAGFNAISDYDLLAPTEREGFNHEQSAMLTYAMVFSNLFTENRSNVNHELGFVTPARKMAKEAIEAYSRNEPEQLGKLLAHGLRHNMKEAASLYQLGHRNTWGFLYLLNKTVETMDKHEGVWEATGLTQEEMDRARGYAELYKVLTRGHEARQELLEHATGVKLLPQQDLEQAGQDALFASYVLCSVAASHQEQTDKLDTNERKQIADRIGKVPALQAAEFRADAFMQKAKAAQQQAEATNSQFDIDKAKELTEQAQALKDVAAVIRKEKNITNGLMTLSEMKRESAPILKDLIKPDWVTAVKDQLAQHTKLPEALTSNKGIIDLFHSDYELSMITKTLALKPQDNQMEKAPELNGPELQNAEPQAAQSGAAMV